MQLYLCSYICKFTASTFIVEFRDMHIHFCRCSYSYYIHCLYITADTQMPPWIMIVLTNAVVTVLAIFICKLILLILNMQLCYICNSH